MKSKDVEPLGQAAAKPTIDGVLGQIYRRLEKLDGLFSNERGPSMSCTSRKSNERESEAGLNSQISQLKDSLKMELDNLTRSVEFAVERTRDTCTEEVLRRVEKNVLNKIEKAIQDRLDSLTAKVLDLGIKKHFQTTPALLRPKSAKMSKRYFTVACSHEDAVPLETGRPQTESLSLAHNCASPKRKRSSPKQGQIAAPSNIKIQEHIVVDRPSGEKQLSKPTKRQHYPFVSTSQFFSACEAAFKTLATVLYCMGKILDTKRPSKASEKLVRKFITRRQEVRSEFQSTLDNYRKGETVNGSPERVFGIMLKEEKAAEAFRIELHDAMLTN